MRAVARAWAAIADSRSERPLWVDSGRLFQIRRPAAIGAFRPMVLSSDLRVAPNRSAPLCRPATTSKKKFVRDFVAAWNKVMNLDRYDLLAQARAGR
jgi:hypothetical protein